MKAIEKKSMEEKAYPKMEALLKKNGLQITLKVFIDALDNLIDERGETIESVMILETLKGLHTGYLKRYNCKDIEETKDVLMVRCIKSLFKSTYKKNAFIKNKNYELISKDDVGSYIRDEEGNEFGPFDYHLVPDRHLYVYKDYFED